MSILLSGLSILMGLFLMFKHPLSLVLLLISLSLSMMIFLLSMMNFSWGTMIMFLVFLGGLLVIFSYLSAMVPNEFYLVNMQWYLLMMSPFFSLIYLKANTFNETKALMSMLMLSDMSLIHLFMCYLLLTLMVTMLMAQQLKSPLSQNNY